MEDKKTKILIDSASPQERRSFLKKLGGVVAGTAALGGFTNLFAKKTYSGTELSAYASPEAYIGSITMFGGNFAIRQWALCNGQLQSISQNTALFSILGTTFGGDGRTTFGLPEMRGRVPLHAGTGPGLTFRKLGTRSGSQTNVLTLQQLPVHNHTANYTAPTYSGSVTPKALNGRGSKVESPENNYPANSSGVNIYADADNVVMGASDVTITNTSPGSVTINNNGGSQQVNNMQPWLCVNFIICLFGVYPPRN